MLSSITPVGEHARGQRWGVTVAAYVVGSVLGGSVVGAVLGGLGWLALREVGDRVALAVLAATAVVGLGVDLAGHLPSRHRQVNERWLGTYRGWVYGAGFGFQLGSGVATIVPASATYVALVAALLSRTPLAGLAVGATYGAARALPILATRRLHAPQRLRGFHRRLADIGRPVHRAVQGIQMTMAMVAVGIVVAA